MANPPTSMNDSNPNETFRAKLQFQSNGPVRDHATTLRVYTQWSKCRKTLIDAFPTAHHTEFAQKLKLYGTQRYWLLTWVERFQQSKTIGESDFEINNAWAALALHYLDQIWPHLDNPEPHITEQLDAIHQLTNKVKGHKLIAIGISAECVAPKRIEGFIDLFTNTTNNNDMIQWIENTFMPKSGSQPNLKSK